MDAGDGAQQGALGVAIYSAGCSILGLWAIPALLKFLRPDVLESQGCWSSPVHLYHSGANPPNIDE